MIPFFDLSRQINELRPQLEQSFSSSLTNATFIGGAPVSLLEKEVCSYLGSKHCVGVSSGTDALLASFMSLDLNRDDEILVTSFTFASSATSILRAGLKPVFVDLQEGEFYPSIENYKKAWTNKTKGILVVHLFGEPIELKEISNLCKERNAYLIEDCAQSFGTKFKDGNNTGTVGDIGTFSFFPAKNLGCLGDGGAVVTNNDETADKINAIKIHGCKIKYQHDVLGGNFRLDTIQASFLSIMLKNLDYFIEKRKSNALFYNKHLSNIPNLVLPSHSDGHSYNQYTLRTNRRNELKDFLDLKKIGNMIYYPYPLHQQKVFGKQREMPNTEKVCSEVLSIPIYPHLREEERDLVIKTIKEFYGV